MFDLLVYIGRFQPFHLGHELVLKTALEQSKAVLVLVGSAHGPSTTKNPFTYSQVNKMIRMADVDQSRVEICGLCDYTYNDTQWLSMATKVIEAYSHNREKVGIIGCDKDDSTYYLHMFPQYESLLLEHFSRLDATNVRRMMFEGKTQKHEMIDTVLSRPVADFVFDFMDSTHFKDVLVPEYKYETSYDPSKFDVNVVCVDAVVECLGHVLLVKRKNLPGKGMYALPGGHLEINETFSTALIRELKEETKLKIPGPVLEGSIVSNEIFDKPNRSARARVITRAYHIHLKREKVLPEVRGADDAERAFWMPIADLDRTQFFEDHYYIIQKLLGL